MMTCEDLLELVGAVASGDVELDDVSRAHLETCPRCAGALAAAQRLEMLLQASVAPAAPNGFSATVLQRIRRERWRSEQRVDRLFNVALVAALLVIVGGVLAMLNLDMVFVLAGRAWTVAKEGLHNTLEQAVPALATYVAAAGLLASAFVMWWWAERSFIR